MPMISIKLSLQQRKLLQAVYRFGVEVGYANHDEAWGWVYERRAKLFARAKIMKINRLAQRVFEKGKKDGKRLDLNKYTSMMTIGPKERTPEKEEVMASRAGQAGATAPRYR